MKKILSLLLALLCLFCVACNNLGGGDETDTGITADTKWEDIESDIVTEAGWNKAFGYLGYSLNRDPATGEPIDFAPKSFSVEYYSEYTVEYPFLGKEKKEIERTAFYDVEMVGYTDGYSYLSYEINGGSKEILNGVSKDCYDCFDIAVGAIKTVPQSAVFNFGGRRWFKILYLIDTMMNSPEDILLSEFRIDAYKHFNYDKSIYSEEEKAYVCKSVDFSEIIKFKFKDGVLVGLQIVGEEDSRINGHRTFVFENYDNVEVEIIEKRYDSLLAYDGKRYLDELYEIPDISGDFFPE